MDEILKILFIEDMPTDAEMIWREIKKHNISFEKVLVETESDFVAALKSFSPDLIISDFSLPQFDGLKALALKNELAPSIPFILVTGSINEEIAVETMKAGADDYIIKQNLSRLGAAIKGALIKRKIIREKELAEMSLRESDERLRSIFRVAPTGIGIVKNRIIEEVNPRVCEMIGYTEKELVGASAEIFYATTEEFNRVGKEKYKQIEEKSTGVVETIWKRKDGTLINIILASTPLVPGDISHGLTFTALDISDRKRAEEKLKQKIEELEQFNELTVDREIRMIELKKEVNELLKLSGKTEKYKIVD